MDDTDRLQRPSKLVYSHFHAAPLWTGVQAVPSCKPIKREPIVLIEKWVDRLANLLKAGNWLQTAGGVEETVPPDVLAWEGVWGDVLDNNLTVGAARWSFGETLRHLLVVTGVQPVVAWVETADEPALSLEGVGVLGLLSLQLVTFLMRGAQMVFCRSCAQTFIVKNRRGRPRYCSGRSCKRDRDRRRKAKYRQKQSKASG